MLRIRILRASLCIAAACVLLNSGCTGQTAGTSAIPVQMQTNSSLQPGLSPVRLHPDSWNDGRNIYVASASNVPYETTILVFGAAANGNVAPIRTIHSPLLNGKDISAMAVDASDYLYLFVQTLGHNQIIVFAPLANGNNVPAARVIAGDNTRMMGAEGMDVDASGRIYVSENVGLTKGVILEFAPLANGNVAPSAFIAPAPLWRDFWGVEGGQSHLYIAQALSQGLRIEMFSKAATGVTPPLCTISYPSAIPYIYQDLAKGPDIYPLWAAVEFPVSELVAYSDCNSTPVGVIRGPNTGLTNFKWVSGMAVDSRGTLYEVSFNEIPSAIRAWAVGNQNGNVTPTTLISGANTNLGILTAIAIGP